MKVWILMAVVYNGHFVWPIVPTIEFSTQQKCEQARIKITEEIQKFPRGKFEGYCLEIEK
jgi:hypothetical protein